MDSQEFAMSLKKPPTFRRSTMRKDLAVSHFSIYDELYDQEASIQDNPRESHQLFDPNIVSQLLAKALCQKKPKLQSLVFDEVLSHYLQKFI